MAVSAELQQLNQQVAQMVSSLQKLVAAQSQTAKEMFDYSQTVDDLTELNKDDFELEKKLQSKKHLMTKNELRQFELYQEALRKRVELEKKEAAIQNDLYKLSERRLSGEMTPAEYQAKEKNKIKQLEHVRDSLKTTGNSITNHEKGLSRVLDKSGNKFNVLIAILEKTGSAFLAFTSKLTKTSGRTAGVIEEHTGNFDQGMAHWLSTTQMYSGMAGEDFLEMMAKNRQMVNAMGGIIDAYETAIPSIDDFYAMTGDMGEASRFAMQAMTQFAEKGINPSRKALLNYRNDIWQVAKQTGLSLEQSQTMFNEIAGDIDSLSILKAAREDERETILANQRALVKSNVALGMNAEQAKEAAKMLNKMVAQKPLERLKQAAKVRALGAAMGMGAESAAAAEAITAGKRATPEQRKALNDFNVAVTGMADTAAQQGIAQELFTSTLLDKLDLDQYYGSDSKFSATLGNIMGKNQDEVASMYKQGNDSILVSLQQLFDIGAKAWESIKDGTWLMGYIVDATRYIPKVIASVEWLGATISEYLLKGLSFLPAFGDNETKKNIAEAHARREIASAKMAEDTATTHKTQAQNEIAEIKNKYDTEQAKIKERGEAERAEIKRRGAEGETYKEATARPVSPGETQQVKVVPDPTTESKNDNRAYKTEEQLDTQTELLSQHKTTIDEQLKQMVNSNEYLKVIAETNPKLVDLAEKQLAVSTMTQEQRDRMASRMRSESAKFSADYSYAL